MNKIFKLILGLLCVVGLYAFSLPVLPDRPLPDETWMKAPVSDIPDEENGYFALAESVDGITDKEKKELFGAITEFPLESADNTEALVDKYGDRIRLLKQAATAQSLAQKPITFEFNNKIPNYIEIKYLAQLKLLSALRELGNGNPGAALESAAMIMALGLNMSSPENPLISVMVGMALQEDALQVMDLIVEESEPSREYFERVASVIPNNKQNVEAMKWSISAEYLTMKNQFIKMRDTGNPMAGTEDIADEPGKKYGWKDRYGIWSMLKPNRSMWCVSSYWSPLLKQVGSPYGEVEFIEEPWEKGMGDIWLYKEALRGNAIGAILISVSGSALDMERILKRVYYSEFAGSAMKLKLATLAYEEEKGKLPDSLEALAPDYIKDIPRDPFDGKPMKYDPDQRLIYSVGTDLKDDGGKTDRVLETLDYFSGSKDEPDFVLPIHPRITEGTEQN